MDADHVLRYADQVWDETHHRAAHGDGVTPSFGSVTIPFPLATAGDPDWIEVRTCRTCNAVQPHPIGRNDPTEA